MFSTVVAAFVLAASVHQVAAEPSRARHLYAARAYAQDSHLLEDYDTYHGRYMDIGCVQAKKNKDTGFFNDCCHPLAKDGSSVPAKCTGSKKKGNSGSSNSTEASPPAAYSPAPTPDPAPAPTPDPAPEPSKGSGSSQKYSGGFATYFYQNGVAGACGAVHSDNDYIVAADYRQYGNLSKQSDLCGKTVVVTNTKNGKSVTCKVVDACPTCTNANSLDLSEGAFKAIATLDDGMVPIEYHFA